MRAILPIAVLLSAALTACAPTTPPPAASATQATPDPRNPRERAKAVERTTLDAKQRQDEALEKQGG